MSVTLTPSVAGDGDVAKQVSDYLGKFAEAAAVPLVDRTDREGDGAARGG